MGALVRGMAAAPGAGASGQATSVKGCRQPECAVAGHTYKVAGTQSLDGGRLVEPVVAGGDETTVVGVETWGVELDDGVVVLVGEPSVSGLTQPAGGADVPACPGTSTVPAQPKFDKMVSSVTIEPSGRVY